MKREGQLHKLLEKELKDREPTIISELKEVRTKINDLEKQKDAL